MGTTLVLTCPNCKDVANFNIWVNAYDEMQEFELKAQCRECNWVGFKFIHIRGMLTEDKSARASGVSRERIANGDI